MEKHNGFLSSALAGGESQFYVPDVLSLANKAPESDGQEAGKSPEHPEHVWTP
jgi:hypothetical protein